MLSKVVRSLALSFFVVAPTISLAAETKGSGRPDVYTTQVIRVRSDVSFDNAKKAMEGLNAVLTKTKGFEKRNLYYDKEQKLWIDQIKWKHVDVAKSGLKALEADPAYSELQKITDGKAIGTYQAERVLELEAK